MGFLLAMAGLPLALDVGSSLDTLPLHLERYLIKRTESENGQSQGTWAVSQVSQWEGACVRKQHMPCVWKLKKKTQVLLSPSILPLSCFVLFSYF
jgi:hypothetical protein